MDYFQLPFIGGKIHDIVGSCLTYPIPQTYPAPTLKIIYKPYCVVPNYGKGTLAVQPRSVCSHNFTCTCATRYIGRTARKFSKRISERHPAALRKGTVKCINNSILQHLIHHDHHVNHNEALNVVYQNPTYLSSGVRLLLLSTVESMAIRIYKFIKKNKPCIYLGPRILRKLVLFYY